MKRFLIHIGIMTVCLVTLLAVIWMNAGDKKSAPESAGDVLFRLTGKSLADDGPCSVIQLTAEGLRIDGTPLLMVYYQYTLRSVGDAACELEVSVQNTPHPGYIPLLCSPNGEFSIRIPVWKMKHIQTFFQGEKLSKNELEHD